MKEVFIMLAYNTEARWLVRVYAVFCFSFVPAVETFAPTVGWV